MPKTLRTFIGLLWRGWGVLDFFMWLAGSGVVQAVVVAFWNGLQNAGLGWLIFFLVCIGLLGYVLVSRLVEQRLREAESKTQTIPTPADSKGFYDHRVASERLIQQIVQDVKVVRSVIEAFIVWIEFIEAPSGNFFRQSPTFVTWRLRYIGLAMRLAMWVLRGRPSALERRSLLYLQGVKMMVNARWLVPPEHWYRDKDFQEANEALNQYPKLQEKVLSNAALLQDAIAKRRQSDYTKGLRSLDHGLGVVTSVVDRLDLAASIALRAKG